MKQLHNDTQIDTIILVMVCKVIREFDLTMFILSIFLQSLKKLIF